MREFITEQEANTKHCPAARTIIFSQLQDPLPRVSTAIAGAAGNRFQDQAITCLGSTCMWWEWEKAPAGNLMSMQDGAVAPARLGRCGILLNITGVM